MTEERLRLIRHYLKLELNEQHDTLCKTLSALPFASMQTEAIVEQLRAAVPDATKGDIGDAIRELAFDLFVRAERLDGYGMSGCRGRDHADGA